MLKLIVSRLLVLPLLLLLLSALIFALLYVLPGDPARIMAGEYASAETVDRIRIQMGFDRHPVIQYLSYLKDVIQGEWGRSYQSNRLVLEDIKQVFPKTIRITIVAELISVLLGVSCGVIAAAKHNSWVDRLLMTISVLSLSMPLFWLALLLQLLFAMSLGWLPPSGSGPLLSRFIILPALTLAIPSSGYLARITRAAMLDTRQAEYVLTARSKGIKESRVIIKHMLPNAWLPIISVIGVDLARLLAGVAIIEVIFSWPGLGKYAFDALAHRDFPALQASLNVLGSVVLFINLAADVLYGLADPRVRSDENV
jgi:ABC-type dipeptide/oligopeptide/nickel transport system permease component